VISDDWASLVEVREIFPRVTDYELTTWSALGYVAVLCEPTYRGGRFAGAEIRYKISDIQRRLSDEAVIILLS
jgi:hypothetical protein